jgi:hypothetical protein
MILDRPPKDWKRPTLRTQSKLQCLINQEGRCNATGARLGTVENTHFDHRPPASERKFDTAAWDTIPPFHDPAHIEAITVAAHDKRTNGPGGIKRIHTAGSDTGNRRKARKVAAAQAEHADAMAAKASGQPRKKSGKPKQKIPARRFQSGRRFSSRAQA